MKEMCEPKCSIRDTEEIDSAECLLTLNSEIEMLRRKDCTVDEIVDVMISVLAFKYWHENCSCQVNSMVESDDVDYVRINWPLFCKSNIGKALRCKAKCDKYDIIAGAIGRISRYVTHRHFDEDNIDLITQLASLIESQTGKTSKDRFMVLKSVYGRALTRNSDCGFRASREMRRGVSNGSEQLNIQAEGMHK